MKQLVFVITVLLFSFSSIAKVERIEPANWWVGMHLNKLQILVYGENIGDYNPSFDGEGIAVLTTTRVPNPNYIFVEVQIAENALPGKRTLNFTQNGQIVEGFDYWLYERERRAEEIEGFNSSDVIYLITPDRFANGNKANDNVTGMKEKANREFHGGRHGGDIAGLNQNLDYIKDLGFTAVWINPLLENDMEEFSYHGYSTTDFYKVDPRYGTNEEYKALVDNARSKGMKVIMDLIANHIGSEHWWMGDLPSEDWLNTWPEYTQTSHRKISILDPYASQRDKDVYEKGWFVKTMPDLNQRNKFLANYLIQNSIWWVEYLGISGIRMDTYSYSDAGFLTDWTTAVMAEYPNFNIVGEEWFAEPTLVSYWQKDKKNDDGYTSELLSLCDFPMEFTLIGALKNDESFGSGLIEIYELLGHDYLYAHPENLLTFPDNHDMSRLITQLEGNYDKYKMALSFLATTRGIPMFYYGTEILMDNDESGEHGVIRSDFPGGWEGDAVNGFTGAGLTKQQKEAKAFVSKLLNWRKTSKAVKSGKLMHFEVHNGVYVYFRYTENEKIMVLMNKNKDKTEVPLKEYSEMLIDVTKGRDVLNGDKYNLTKPSIRIDGISTTIIKVE